MRDEHLKSIQRSLHLETNDILDPPLLLPESTNTMKIYTRTGDFGETGLAGGGRTAKNSMQMEAVGTIDELNACLGVIRSLAIEPEWESDLSQIQSRLFDVGALLASKPEYDPGVTIGEQQILSLESKIDALEANLTPLQQFILPSGSPAGAQTHFARTICRRAERRVLTWLASASPAENSGIPIDHHPIPIYLNRLSDYLFVLARTINADDGITETPWLGASGS
tara:strand:- start:27107 stop:27781 length:675 start_codon:yes stop_codon:yes gene_type:complete